MSLCVQVNSTGVLKQSFDASCEYILLSQGQVTELVNNQFDISLVQFDADLFEYLLARMLVSFIVGHVLGRVLKSLGKI